MSLPESNPSPPPASAYLPTENYGVIGDLHTTALVSLEGSVDFFSFPRFDSPTVFAALLDAERGGHFAISPLEQARCRQVYIPDSNILLTRFFCDGGLAEITDFMPTRSEHRHRIVRRVEIIRGKVALRLRCAPRFDYARREHQVEACEGGVRFVSEGLSLQLLSSVHLTLEKRDATAEFSLQTGESATFVLEEAQADSPAAAPDFSRSAFAETLSFWQRWAARSTYRGRWREAVMRSALTLKLLTYEPEGSIVAAPTFGLPEEIGGERNWDYRYSWIRDSSFAVYALSRLGYTEEMASFMHWIFRRCTDHEARGEAQLQPLYGIGGERELPETILTHFSGYRDSSPVRIGNGAFDQLQLDVYGALMDSVYLFNKYGELISFDLWQQLTRHLDWVCENWQRPDQGIWELRGPPQPFLYSRLMCWVALDRGVRLARKRSFPAPVERWEKVRDEIYLEIVTNFWNEDKGAFVQTPGSDALDASCLLMPLVRFVGPRDPRWLSTLEAVERELVEETFVYRYRVGNGNGDGADDGASGSEGSFNICSFWYVECLARSGQLDRARLVFEKFLGFANHVGLFAEETGNCGQQLGNYPQTFTHLGLISAAFELNRQLEGDRGG